MPRSCTLHWEPGPQLKPLLEGEWMKYIKTGSYDTQLKILITMEILTQKIDHLKKGKATGTDKIANELLTKMPNKAKEILLEIMNRIIGHIPDAWRHSKTILLYKTQEKTNPMKFVVHPRYVNIPLSPSFVRVMPLFCTLPGLSPLQW